MSNFLENYETVDSRIHKFWEKYPAGRILTSVEFYPETNRWVCKAEVHRDETGVVATGYAEEVIGSSMVNKTAALENAETSAIGRALANLGFATKGARPSVEEMQKVNRTSGNTKPRNLVPGTAYGDAATQAQLGAVENCAKAFARKINTPASADFVLGILTLATGRKIEKLDDLTKFEASEFINERKEDFVKLQPKFDEYMTKKGQGN